jgi:glycosyltransferase involved in cell wall biosynthesis
MPSDASPWRVLIIAEKYPPDVGGLAVATARNAHGLAAAGLEVHVLTVTSAAPPGVMETEREGAVPVHRLGALRQADETLQMAGDMIELLQQRHGFHLLHGFYVLQAGFLAVLQAQRLGLKAVVSVRGNDLDRSLYQGSAFGPLHWTLARADAVACVSADLRRWVEALTGRRDVQETPNAVDGTVFQPRPPEGERRRALFPQEEDPTAPILGSVGELRFKKGLHILLETFRRVRQRRPARLLLVGGARRAEREFLRNFLDRHRELQPEVQLVPYVQDRAELAAYYHLMEVVLFPSLWEGMPNALLEAMACGRVVVASDAGGIKQVLRHGENGALLSRHQLEHLADLTLEVLALPEATRAQWGRQARADMLTHFTPERETARLLEIYRQLTG